MGPDYKTIAEVAALAGKIMLESHAESYRVEETVLHILRTSGFTLTEVVSTTTGLMLTLDDEDPNIDPITLVRRVDNRANHLNKIYRVNNISRKISNQEISIDQAHLLLQQVDAAEYTIFSKDLATILLVVGFAILFDANSLELALSFLAGSIVALSRLVKDYLNLNPLMFAALSPFLTALLITGIVYYLPFSINSDIIVISALMPIYPGMAFTNGLRDVLKGDYVSGLARIADAFVIATSIAIGVALGLFLLNGVISWM